MFPDDLSDIICRHYFISGGARSQRYLMKLEAERAFRKRCKARRLEREAREDRSYQVGLCVRASIFSVGMVAGFGLIGCFNGGDANHCSPALRWSLGLGFVLSWNSFAYLLFLSDGSEEGNDRSDAYWRRKRSSKYLLEYEEQEEAETTGYSNPVRTQST